MLPVLNIGPAAIPTAPFALLLGLWLGLTWAERTAPKLGVEPTSIYNLAFTAAVAGIIGARVVYIFEHLAAFEGNWLSFLSPNPAMLSADGGLVTALLIALIYGQRLKLPLWATLDALTPLFAVFAIALAISHAASGTAFGRPTSLPWGINLWGEVRHPTQIYETAFAIGIGFLVWYWIKNLQHPAGTLFLTFSAATALSLIFLHFFRADSLVMFGTIRTAQITAWIALAACLWLLGIKLRSATVIPTELQEGE